MKTDRRKFNWQTTIELNAPFGSFDKLWDIGMTRIEARVGINDPNNRPRKCIFTIARALMKAFRRNSEKCASP